MIPAALHACMFHLATRKPVGRRAADNVSANRS